MLMKLVMAYTDDCGSMIRAGAITKWHKQEGERVEYGDDLFDMKVEEVALPEAQLKRGEGAQTSPGAIAKVAAKQMEADEEPPEAAPDGAERRLMGIFYLRVTSSDRGVLRRIQASEGQRKQAGDVLAMLSSNGDEPVEQAAGNLGTATIFRIVANVFQTDRAGLESPFECGEVERNRQRKRYLGRNFVVTWSASPGENPAGIYAYGPRYLKAVLACAPLVQPVLSGSCCIYREAAPAVRSDVMLQALRPLPQEWLEAVSRNLSVSADCMRPDVFSRTFPVAGVEGIEEFPKTVVVLSIVRDAGGACYRHRQNGFLMDPGDNWLSYLTEEALAGSSPERLAWFHENFETAGQLPVEGFVENFTQVVSTFQRQARAQVLVFNALTVMPGYRAHNYRFVPNSPDRRRLEFNLALLELSRKLDFSVVDVDGILKRAGIQSQPHWDQLNPALHLRIAKETFRIMKDRGVF